VVGAGAATAAGTDVFDPKAEHDAFQAAVAEELGVTTKQLQDAYKTAALDRLDAAVAAGRITKEQADAMRTRIQSGEFGPMGGMGGPGMHGPEMRGPHAGHLDAAATYLGLTEAQLREKLIAGQSLAEVLEAKRVRPEVSVVYLNKARVERDALSATQVADGDTVEIIIQLAGGSHA